ncbi:MAG: MltA domain-containing protein [Alphaproteobacteria bacterium]|nr:MltA domain-containing protein [Alphaproteobacteria bacterium]
MRFLLCLSLLFCLTACDQAETPQEEPAEQKPPELILTSSDFDKLPEWGKDTFEGFAQSFARSCSRIMKRSSDEPFGVMGQDHKEVGTYGDWQAICKKFSHIKKPEQIKSFFEQSFTPYQVSANTEISGTFTGYYEASLYGSHTKSECYNIPLHKRPKDLVMVNLGEFREELKGTRIAGRVSTTGQLKPYETREKITKGDWPHTDAENILLWVDNAVDAFFVQIQGSGLVKMQDGRLLRIGYGGQNGHSYYAIGRELIKRGELTKENVSMQTIRSWLESNPNQANEIMNTNKSYVFFRTLDKEGPIGAEGTVLTPLRSLAIDRVLISYGTPLWLSTQTQNNISSEQPSDAPDIPALNRMMIAQDTGGAITGPVRGDVFWGHGKKAETMAGYMNAKGRYWVMLPKASQE